MALETLPSYLYIDRITQDNRFANFVEPNVSAAELLATVAVGSRAVTSLLTFVESAFNAAGTQDYTWTFDRVTRRVTVTSNDTFTMLVTSGSNSSQSIYATLGFTSDKSGSSSYVSDEVVGTRWVPQFFVQQYTPFENFQSVIESSKNKSASGVIEKVTYTSIQKMKSTFRYITNEFQSPDSPIRNEPDGIEQARAFLNHITTEGEVEYSEDYANPAIYSVISLDRIPGDRNGTGFELREENINGYFRIGPLTFEKIV